MSKNTEIARVFTEIADMLEILAENRFKIRAYRNASRTIAELGDDITVVAARGELEAIPGVGRDLAKKISDYLDSGVIPEHERLKDTVPPGLVQLLGIQELGPKTVALLHEDLGVAGIDDLERAIQGGALLELPRMGAKKIAEIKKGIEVFKKGRERQLIGEAMPLALELLGAVREIPGVERASLAGSLRRGTETIGDIDILAAGESGGEIIGAFTTLPVARDIIASGDTKGTITVEGGRRVDLRVVPGQSWGAALLYFTGSEAHNVRLRQLAIKLDLSLNEYGLFEDGDNLASETEEHVYARLGLGWLPPELREDRGEIEAALDSTLPELVEETDIRGDLHMHTTWSDGRASIEEMARAAIALGYEYIAITDHSPSSRVAHGLSLERLMEKKAELRGINDRLPGIEILMGAEVDILPDGTLDYPDRTLAELDIVLASVHSHFGMDSATMTERITTALKHPSVHALVHPTGRLLGRREPYELDMDAVIETAGQYGKALEINASYMRLDLKDTHARKARDSGVKLMIGTDAHSTGQLSMMRYGMTTARRGWARKDDILNTLPLPDLRRWLEDTRSH